MASGFVTPRVKPQESDVPPGAPNQRTIEKDREFWIALEAASVAATVSEVAVSEVAVSEVAVPNFPTLGGTHRWDTPASASSASRE